MVGSVLPNKKTGTYYGRVDIPRGADGRRRQVRVHGRTEAEVEKKIRKVLHDVEAGLRTPRENRGYTVDHAIDAWLSQSRGLAFRTYESYESEARRHLRPKLGAVRVTELTPGRIQDVIAAWQREGRSSNSINYYLTLLRMVMDRVRRDRYRLDNPMDDVRRPKRTKPRKPAAPPELAGQILGALAGGRLFTPFFFQISQGIRPGELLAIRRGGVDIQTGSVRVDGALEYRGTHLERKSPKTDASNRVLYPPRMILAMLEEELRVQSERFMALGIVATPEMPIFDRGDGGYWHPDSFRRAYTRRLAAADVTHVPWRGARHTFATLARKLKADRDTIRTILGHESSKTTDQFYIDDQCDPEEARAASEAVVTLIAQFVSVPDPSAPES
jgi:integrase